MSREIFMDAWRAKLRVAYGPHWDPHWEECLSDYFR